MRKICQLKCIWSSKLKENDISDLLSHSEIQNTKKYDYFKIRVLLLEIIY